MRVLCYCRGLEIVRPPEDIIMECEQCGNMYPGNWHPHIKEIAKRFKNLGYDADIQTVCTECAIKLGLIDEIVGNYRVNYLFKFKARGQEKWHLAYVKDLYDISAVIAFLENRPLYYNEPRWYDHHFTKAKLDRIIDLTGISVEELMEEQ